MFQIKFEKMVKGLFPKFFSDKLKGVLTGQCVALWEAAPCLADRAGSVWPNMMRIELSKNGEVGKELEMTKNMSPNSAF
jgi:hypothetical protein